MTHEIKEMINLLTETDELSSFKSDDLIDVFGLWDCYAQDWVPNTPLVLRFEQNDLLVRRLHEGFLEVSLGSVDTSNTGSVDTTSDVVLAPSLSDDQCLCWLRM